MLSVLILLLCGVISYAVEYQALDSFGLLTVTHSRGGDFTVLEKYLERYTQMECYGELISQINIIWNNEEQIEKTSVLKDIDKWKIPVYFYRTAFNSMDHRYRLPKESTAQLLYSLDDDIIVDCQTFKMTLDKFNEVNQNLLLGKITTNEVRAFGFDPKQAGSDQRQYFYQGHAAAVYYTIAEPGAAFIPRHYVELYYLNLGQIQVMHKWVLDVKNCDDIFFWAIVQHFYPELPAVYVRGMKNYKNTDPKIGQSKTKNVYGIRSQCIEDISNALGYNSLRHYHKNYSLYLNNWQYPNLDIILNQKIGGLAGVQSVQGEQKGVPENSALAKKTLEWQGKIQLKNEEKDKLKEVEEKKIENKVQEQKVKQDPPKTESTTVQPETKPQPEQPKPLTQQHKKPQQPKQPQQPNKPKQSQLINPQQTKTKPQASVPKPIQSKPQFQYQRAAPASSNGGGQSFWSLLTSKVVLLLLIIFLLTGLLFFMYKQHRSTSNYYSHRLADYEQQQSIYTSSIRLPDHY